MNKKILKISIDKNKKTFIKEDGTIFNPVGLNYFRPEQGWAPRIWKKFDKKKYQEDFNILSELGLNCVRIFLTFSSFYNEPDKLDQEGIDKFDQLLQIAEKSGIYIHPTGPDFWEGHPEWLWNRDFYSDKYFLEKLCVFWQLFVERYKNRAVIFAYDLKNEPRIPWHSETMQQNWLKLKYKSPYDIFKKNNININNIEWQKYQELTGIPDSEKSEQKLLIEYQKFREATALNWMKVQRDAIKSADPDTLVTVGSIQMSLPIVLQNNQDYAAFTPAHQAQILDFLSFHFYPVESPDCYQYQNTIERDRNLAYLEFISSKMAAPGLPVVIGEFGWYTGPVPENIKNRRKTIATEDDQADWNLRLIEATKGFVCGWLNWGMYDHPDASDVTKGTGLFTAAGKPKIWSDTISKFALKNKNKIFNLPAIKKRPLIDEDQALSNPEYRNTFFEKYYSSYKNEKNQIE